MYSILSSDLRYWRLILIDNVLHPVLFLFLFIFLQLCLYIQVCLFLSGSGVTLGGVEYPVGSRVGKTGTFVIGDPGMFDPRNNPNLDTSR